LLSQQLEPATPGFSLLLAITLWLLITFSVTCPTCWPFSIPAAFIVTSSTLERSHKQAKQNHPYEALLGLMV
jgi:hypothetical protein